MGLLPGAAGGYCCWFIADYVGFGASVGVAGGADAGGVVGARVGERRWQA